MLKGRQLNIFLQSWRLILSKNVDTSKQLFSTNSQQKIHDEFNKSETLMPNRINGFLENWLGLIWTNI